MKMVVFFEHTFCATLAVFTHFGYLCPRENIKMRKRRNERKSIYIFLFIAFDTFIKALVIIFNSEQKRKITT